MVVYKVTTECSSDYAEDGSSIKELGTYFNKDTADKVKAHADTLNSSLEERNIYPNVCNSIEEIEILDFDDFMIEYLLNMPNYESHK